MRGPFISFEGGEGSGKTTQLNLLAESLRARGRSVIITREPGGTEMAESIRRLLVEGEADRLDAVSETLLFLAARHDHWRNIIAPAISAGQIVLCDRFMDSTLVYQGIGKGLGVEYVRSLSRLALGTLQPDITLLFDISPEAGLQRAHARPGRETRFEQMGQAFHAQVREGFLMLAKAEPGRIRIIDAGKTIDMVSEQVMRACEDILV